jgi:hypothetical protein
VTLLLTDANDSVTNWSIKVKGSDAKDQSIEETFFFQNGKDQTGKVEFKSIREVELDNVSGSPASADVLDIGTAPYTTCWVPLGNKPIKYASETHSGSKIRNTDFYMDYANGRIKYLSGSAGIDYTISYTIGQVWLDLNNVPDLIRVEHVVYPVGDIPQTRITWDIWGSIIVITSSGEYGNQESMAEDRQIAVYYSAVHYPPTSFGPGSYPDFLENTVLLAAGAYALFTQSQQYRQQSVTDFQSARTELSNISHTAVATALLAASVEAGYSSMATDKVDAYLAGSTESAKALLAQIDADAASLRTAQVTAIDAAGTTLNSMSFANTESEINDAAVALRNVHLYLVSNTADSSEFWIKKITTDIAELRDKVKTAVDAANTYLDDAGSDLSSNTTNRVNYLGTTNYVDGDIRSYLSSGEALLNTISIGGENERTPEVYALYARTARESLITPHEQDRSFYIQAATGRTNAALAYSQESAQRLSNLRSYIEQADAWGRVASGFVNEATQRIQSASMFIGIEQTKANQAGGYTAESSQRLDSLRTYMEQALSYVRIAEGFVSESRERNAAARSYLDEASTRISEMDAYMAKADRYTALGVHNIALADKFREEANMRRDEAWSIWRDRKQYIGDFTSASVRQYS